MVSHPVALPASSVPPGAKLLPLTTGEFAIVDELAFDWVNQWKWTTKQSKSVRYVIRRVTYVERTVTIRLHRLLTGAPPGLEVDHINRNPLDNRLVNLRICTSAENQANKARPSFMPTGWKAEPRVRAKRAPKVVAPLPDHDFRGVSVDTRKGKYRAWIWCGGKFTSLGYYSSAADAALAYDAAARRLHGEFARLNFPLAPVDAA